MIRVTAVHMVGGEQHEHIDSVRWTNLANNGTGQNTRAEMVDWLEKNPNQAVVDQGGKRSYVGVVKASPPYIRTYADGQWNNNLLALPRY